MTDRGRGGCKCAVTKGWSEQRGRHGLKSEEDKFITRVNGTVNQNLDEELGFCSLTHTIFLDLQS